MSDYDYPIFFGNSQYRIYPCQLLIHILFTGIRISFALVTVFVNQRSGIYHHKTDGSSFLLEDFGIITTRHRPATTHIGIIQHSLRITPVFMISQDRKPVYHQLGMTVNQLVVGHPERIVNAAHTFKMVHVSGCKYTLGTNNIRHFSHQLGYGLLVIITVTSQIVSHIKIQLFLQSFPILRSLGTHIQADSRTNDGNPYPCQYFFHSSNHHQRFHILIFRNLFLNLHSFSRHNILPA